MGAMSGRCKTCVWWRIGAPAEPDQGTCRMADHWAFDATSHPFSLVMSVAVNDDAPAAYLITAPDFGCVQWEAATDEAGVPFYPPTRQE